MTGLHIGMSKTMLLFCIVFLFIIPKSERKEGTNLKLIRSGSRGGDMSEYKLNIIRTPGFEHLTI